MAKSGGIVMFIWKWAARRKTSICRVGLRQATSLNLGTVFIGAFHEDEVKKVLHLAGDEQPLGLMPVGRK